MIGNEAPNLMKELDMKNDKQAPVPVASKSDRMKALLVRAAGVGAAAAAVAMVAVASAPKLPRSLGD